MKLRSKLIGQKKASQKDEDKSECYEEWASEDEDNEGATGDDDEDSGEGESEDESVSKVMNEVVTAEAAASVSTSDKVKCPVSECYSKTLGCYFRGLSVELSFVEKYSYMKHNSGSYYNPIPLVLVCESNEVVVLVFLTLVDGFIGFSGMRRIQKVWKFSAKTGCQNQVFELKVLCGFVIDMETALQGAARQAQRMIDDDNYIGVHSFIGLTDERGKRQRPTTSTAEVKPKVGAEAEISISRFDIRVGLVTKAHMHPDADSLYVEENDVGE
ncbi:methionine--tRNA ligase, partial [Sarracenia purpurea var. burkii]